jgi:hypothetical protein
MVSCSKVAVYWVSRLTQSLAKANAPKAEHGVTRSEINISGDQVLLALAIAFLLTNQLIWAFVGYWLFAA